MLRSIKSQIILALSVSIILVLGATAYLLIDQKTRELNQDIFKRALSFAQLTHQQVIDSFQNNYEQQAFANFERDLASVYSLNSDITTLSIYNYQGQTLYLDKDISQLDTPELERLQSLFPSVKTTEGRILYLESTNNQLRYTNFNGEEVEPLLDTEQITNLVYPFRDPNEITRQYSVSYEVSYQALKARIQQMMLRLSAIATVGLVVALVIGFILAQGITSPIKKLSRGALQIGRGDLTTRIPLQSKSEVGQLATVFNQMASDLQHSTEIMIEHEKTAKELELAVQIQKRLLPRRLPIVDGVEMAASLTAATQVGGDCYDLIPLQKSSGDLLFYVADVTGHGIGAGLVSAINNALVPALITHNKNTKSLVIELNKVLRLKTSSSIFVTMVMALWDAQSGTVQFTQAGHNPILHYQAKEGKIFQLAHGGVALGMIDDVTKVIKTETIAFSQSDLLILYTDGITEARSERGEIYGLERLKKSIEKNSQLNPVQAIHDAILADVRQFMGQHPQDDDITLLIVRRTS